jgi:hypothetical protein
LGVGSKEKFEILFKKSRFSISPIAVLALVLGLLGLFDFAERFEHLLLEVLLALHLLELLLFLFLPEVGLLAALQLLLLVLLELVVGLDHFHHLGDLKEKAKVIDIS